MPPNFYLYWFVVKTVGDIKNSSLADQLHSALQQASRQPDGTTMPAEEVQNLIDDIDDGRAQHFVLYDTSAKTALDALILQLDLRWEGEWQR